MDALLFVFQWQRECDGGVLLLQEGGPCGDCHALYGASSYCGKCVLVLVWDETQKNISAAGSEEKRATTVLFKENTDTNSYSNLIFEHFCTL